jgi:hypothetical protein
VTSPTPLDSLIDRAQALTKPKRVGAKLLQADAQLSNHRRVKLPHRGGEGRGMSTAPARAA